MKVQASLSLALQHSFTHLHSTPPAISRESPSEPADSGQSTPSVPSDAPNNSRGVTPQTGGGRRRSARIEAQARDRAEAEDRIQEVANRPTRRERRQTNANSRAIRPRRSAQGRNARAGPAQAVRRRTVSAAAAVEPFQVPLIFGATMIQLGGHRAVQNAPVIAPGNFGLNARVRGRAQRVLHAARGHQVPLFGVFVGN